MTKRLSQKNNIAVLDEEDDIDYSKNHHELSRWIPEENHRLLSDESLDTMEND